MGLTSRARCNALTFTGEYMMSALSFDTVALSQPEHDLLVALQDARTAEQH